MPCSCSAAAVSANANTNLLNGVIKGSGGKLCNGYSLSVKYIQAIPYDILNCGIVPDVGKALHIASEIVLGFFSKIGCKEVKGSSLIQQKLNSFCSFYLSRVI